jgi:hypothetical protein
MINLLYTAEGLLERDTVNIGYPYGFYQNCPYNGYNVLELPIILDIDDTPKRFIVLYDRRKRPEYIIAMAPTVRSDNEAKGRKGKCVASSKNGYRSEAGVGGGKARIRHYWYETGIRQFIIDYEKYFTNFSTVVENMTQ